MSNKKRRTKKEKINPKYNFLISWKPSEDEAKKSNFEANVNRDLSKDKIRYSKSQKSIFIAKDTGKYNDIKAIKRDLLKSLLYFHLIIASEIMIYLLWYKK